MQRARLRLGNLFMHTVYNPDACGKSQLKSNPAPTQTARTDGEFRMRHIVQRSKRIVITYIYSVLACTDEHMCVSPGWASARLDAHVHVHVHDLIPSFESVYGFLAHVSTDGANFNVTVQSSSVVVEREYFRALRREYQTRGAVLRHGLNDSPSKPWMK